MPDHDQRAVVLAWREELISKQEAREALGFHSTTGDDAVSFADDIIRLEVELAQAREALRSEKVHSEKQYLAGYSDGFQAASHKPTPLRPSVYPTWIGYPPNKTAGGIYPTGPARTFTVNGAGKAVETLNATTP